MARRAPVQEGWDLFGDPVPGDVYSCLVELGVEIIRQTDDEVLGKCPGHLARTGKEDRHPSWSVNTESGMHNCFSCGFSGTFVQLADFLLPKGEDAISWVRQRGGIERARRTLERHRSQTIDEIDSDEITEASLALFTDPPAEALAKRKIRLEAAQHYDILWDPATGSWITPIREPWSDKLLGYQIKNERYFRNHPKHMEKAGSLFGHAEYQSGPIIVVESPLDVPRMLTAGVAGGVSAYGVQISDAQMNLALGLSEYIIMALDNDKDGKKLSASIKERYGHRARMKFLSYAHTDAKDVGAMEDWEIHQAIADAVPSMLARFS
jgi:5S rRNA maturation endonuclease (ribonuclease M5)